MGPTGFYKSTASKVLCVGTGVGSIAALMALKSDFAFPSICLEVVNKMQLHRIVGSQFLFSSTGEAIFGLALLYQFRMFERKLGSAQYISFLTWSTVLSVSFQLVYTALFRSPSLHLAPGPYAAVFSLFTHFYAHVPKLHRYSFMSIELSDKSLTYLLGLQLMLNRGTASAVPALCGFAAGLIAKHSYLPFKYMRVPKVVSTFFATHVEPWLATEAPQVLFQRQQARARQQPGGGGADGTGAGVRGERLLAQGGGGMQQQIQQQLAAMQQQVAATTEADPQSVRQVMDMGFTEAQAQNALRVTGNNVEQAVNFLLTN